MKSVGLQELAALERKNRSLREVGLFRSMSEAALGSVERRCTWRTFGRGEQIIDHLDESRDVYFLVSGRARVLLCSLEGTIVAFRDLDLGDVFGELSAIDGRPRSASVEPSTDCVLAQLAPRDFLAVLEEHPQASLALIAHLVGQIRDLTERIFEFSTLAVRNRIHAELLRLACQAEPAGNQATLSPAPTNHDIASRISTHREAVSRELSRMGRLGLVRRRGSTLQITDIERLARMVHEASGQ